MRIDIECFHVIAIYKAIVFILGILPTVVLEALPIKILPEGSVW